MGSGSKEGPNLPIYTFTNIQHIMHKIRRIINKNKILAVFILAQLQQNKTTRMSIKQLRSAGSRTSFLGKNVRSRHERSQGQDKASNRSRRRLAPRECQTDRLSHYQPTHNPCFWPNVLSRLFHRCTPTASPAKLEYWPPVSRLVPV